jgi:hypothetical protein
MRALTLLMAALLITFGSLPALADHDQDYLKIKKGNKTQIIKIDPVTAKLLKDTIQSGKNVKIKTAYDYYNDNNKESCCWACRKERRAIEQKYGHKIDWDD